MKIRPLPDTDLARITVLPLGKQLAALRNHRDGHAPYSYAPFRKTLGDIFNVAPELFGATTPTEWTKIERELRRLCKSDDELTANIAVASALHGFALEHRLMGRRQEFFPLQLGFGRRLVYWHPLVVSGIDGCPLIPFVDARKSNRLSPAARRFVLSVMHEHIRATDPDYAAVELVVIQLTNPGKGARETKVYLAEGVDLIGMADLQAMVETTYKLWTQVCQERDDEARKTRNRDARAADLIRCAVRSSGTTAAAPLV